MTGYVYAGELTAGDFLALFQKQVAGAVCLSWDLARLDFSQEPRAQGTAFSGTAELRWWRLNGERYQVLVLSDEPQEGLPLEPVPGEWRTEEVVTQLISTRSARFAPQFHIYPGVDGHQARLRCRLFYRDGLITFISPREVIA